MKKTKGKRHGRSFIGIELNTEYADMARNRISLTDKGGSK